MKDTYENFLQFLRDDIASQVEYETEHQDAGDNYSHMPREGGFDYGNGETRLREYLEENEIVLPDGVEFDSLVDYVLDNFRMSPGHMFGPYDNGKPFSVDSYPVGEIEISIELSNLVEEFGTFARGFWLKAMKDSEFCLRGDMTGNYPCGYAYQSTDCVWYALISADDIREWITWEIEAMGDAA